jgi:hypothetical protein
VKPGTEKTVSREPRIKFHFASSIPSGAKEAAEKGLVSGERPEEHPSGAKALVDLIAFTARLKSCPFKTVLQQEFFRSL